ncbi:MAG: cytochrome C [Desulfuromonadales bacterium]|nr:cytochrome C [Desulfuromonadales bacterium]
MNHSYDSKLLFAAFLGALLLVPCALAAMDSDYCLMCHGDADMVNAELLIVPTTFDTTAHAVLGCVVCHDTIGDDHPSGVSELSRATCLDCHDTLGQEYLMTDHANYAICGDCHNPHEARAMKAMAGYDMNDKCIRCHDSQTMVDVHKVWLPQADLHIAKLPCITCHTGSEGYEIVLNIVVRQDDRFFSRFELPEYQILKEISGDAGILSLIDTNGDNFIALTELRRFNRNPAYRNLRLEGTLVPSDVSHDLKTLDNRYDCTFCHISGPKSLQTSFLAIPNRDGGYQRVTVEQGAVLDALYGTPDFYMVGTTRSASMNILGLLIISAGLVMPIGHGLLRFLTRKNRQH